jgi:hypothetical protein
MQLMWPSEKVKSLPSQWVADDRILKTILFLENYIGTDDWQCRFIRGRFFYVCRTKYG